MYDLMIARFEGAMIVDGYEYHQVVFVYITSRKKKKVDRYSSPGPHHKSSVCR